jgi:hypothetical protein
MLNAYAKPPSIETRLGGIVRLNPKDKSKGYMTVSTR